MQPVCGVFSVDPGDRWSHVYLGVACLMAEGEKRWLNHVLVPKMTDTTTAHISLAKAIYTAMLEFNRVKMYNLPSRRDAIAREEQQIFCTQYNLLHGERQRHL